MSAKNVQTSFFSALSESTIENILDKVALKCQIVLNYYTKVCKYLKVSKLSIILGLPTKKIAIQEAIIDLETMGLPSAKPIPLKRYTDKIEKTVK